MIVHAVKTFLDFKKGNTSYLEISSDSAQKPTANYVRLALTCLRQSEALEIFKELGYSKKIIEPYMLRDVKHDCFGVGITDYDNTREQRRLKLYNYYHKVEPVKNLHTHIKDICLRAKISWPDVRDDIVCFKKLRMSALDFYDNGDVDLKMYFGRLHGRDSCKLLDSKTVRVYRKFLNLGVLGPVVFYIRWGKKGRSITAQFIKDTVSVVPYLYIFEDRESIRLYNDLRAMGAPIKITAIAVTLCEKPRVSFYFELEGCGFIKKM